jgi:release factor glutamine methyltransferase
MILPHNQSFSNTDIIFLSHILGKTRTDIVLNNVTLTTTDKRKLQNYRKQFNMGYPIDYIIGKVKIGDNTFYLNPNVLIPRPETEELIDVVIKNSQCNDLLVDIGTGSGLIGISLSDRFKSVVLTDISQKALNIAKKNTLSNNKSNISTLRSNLLDNKKLQNQIKKSPNWVLVANLPYIPEYEVKDAKKNNVSHEPSIALYSGKEGLDCFRELVNQLANTENLPKQCFFELDPSNIAVSAELIKKLRYTCDVLKDSNDLDRFLICSIID